MVQSWTPHIDEKAAPLYLGIIKALDNDITEGLISDGTRLPTHRELADQLGIALGTVTRAYREAERRGLIHSQGRRGTFVGSSPRRGRGLSSLFVAGAQVIDLSQNHPDHALDPPLGAALKRIAADAELQQHLEYAPSAGMPSHREAGARWLASMGFETEADRLVVTAGGQHALLVSLSALTKPGDTIAAEALTYPGLRAATDMLGLHVVGIEMDDDGPTMESLEHACRHRGVRVIYLNPTLQNPVNMVVSAGRRQMIAEMARKYELMIIEDEILRPLVPTAPPMISSLAPDQSCLIMSASKVIAAGLRVAYVAAPNLVYHRLIDAVRSSMLSVSSLSAEIVSHWLDDGTAQEIIERRREEHRLRLETVAKILAPWQPRYCEDSCHIWLPLPAAWSSSRFVLEAHQRGVAVAPADAFAAERSCREDAIRISLASISDREMMLKGIRTLAGILSGSPSSSPTTI